MEKNELLKNESFEIREYQANIAETASRRNTLVVLPTGMGKTLISILVAAHRLHKYPTSKVLITAPTRPLNAQHKKSFERFTNIDPEKIILITGKNPPEERVQLYKNALVVIATPQTIRNDIENNKLSLNDFSFVTFDEAHRSIKDYAYTYVAKKYKEQSKFPLILGLTASPGGTGERIEEIKKNLFISAVEIRSERDEDVEKHVKEIQKEVVEVELSDDFLMVKGLIEQMLKDDLYWLKEHHFTSSYRPSKKQLLFLQKRISERYSGSKNFSLIWTIMRAASAIKLDHALELLETQGIHSLFDYLKKIQSSKKKTDQKLFKDPRMMDVLKITEKLREEGVEHPKLIKLIEIIKEMIDQDGRVKIIVFANYRSTVDRIKNILEEKGIKAEILIGQAIKGGKGLSQKEQIDVLRRFSQGEFNVLCGTSITEEGLDVPSVDFAIFYEPVASEIRSIQRRGRVGRQTSGKIIFLITKDTRDEAYFYTALHKEKKMKGILYEMKEKNKIKKSLKDWV